MSDIARQNWLRSIADNLAPEFASLGVPLPAFRVTCGFPSTGGTRLRRSRVIGEIHDSSRSADGHCEIFISPVNADSVTVAAVLAHELVHAAVGISQGHNREFGRVARSIGLQGPLTATEAAPAFESKIRRWVTIEGEYPHAALNVSGREKQSTRLLKYVCPECGATGRFSALAFKKGQFKCGVHDKTLVPA
jgi:hypothetical protein